MQARQKPCSSTCKPDTNPVDSRILCLSLYNSKARSCIPDFKVETIDKSSLERIQLYQTVARESVHKPVIAVPVWLLQIQHTLKCPAVGLQDGQAC